MSPDKIKSVVAHPVSTWSAIAVAIITGISAFIEQKEVKAYAEKTTNYAESFEDGHYEAIIDLRKKVGYLFNEVVELDHRVEKFDVVVKIMGGGAIKPPGPSQQPPPGVSDGWHDRYVADHCARCPSCCFSSVGWEDPPSDTVESPKEDSSVVEPPKVEPPKVEPPKVEPPAEEEPFELDENGKMKWKPVKRK